MSVTKTYFMSSVQTQELAELVVAQLAQFFPYSRPFYVKSTDSNLYDIRIKNMSSRADDFCMGFVQAAILLGKDAVEPTPPTTELNHDEVPL